MWEDTTSYAQDERDKIEPRTWELSVKELTLVVTRIHGLDGWYAWFHPFLKRGHDLHTENLSEAKEEALKMAESVMDRFNSLFKELKEKAEKEK